MRSDQGRWTSRTSTAVVGTLVALCLGVGAPTAQAIPRSCGWVVQTTADHANVAYPDEAAAYWLGDLAIPPGGYIEIAGSFPHARYMSLITYTAQSQAIDGINDTQIHPNPGSTNPFLAGGDRTAPKRTYAVRIVNDRIPAGGRAPNTLYTESADGAKTTKATGDAIFVLRNYVPDRGNDIDGGVGLPTLSTVTASGLKTTLGDCPDPVPNTGVNNAVSSSGSGTPFPASAPTTTDPLPWAKYTNIASALVNMNGAETAVPGAVVPVSDAYLPSGGAFENTDNKYVYAQTESTRGQVVVLHAKAPTTPHTIDGEPIMGTGEMRYWSLCTENGQTTAFYGCVNDENVPVDADGFYTIVISTAAARPSNATLACGVAWLPAGPAPRTLLLMRNMLPDPGFAQAIQRIKPGHEREGMGPYYPTGKYYATARAFESRGCARGADRSSAVANPAPGAAKPRPTTRRTVRATCPASRLMRFSIHPYRGRVNRVDVYVGKHRIRTVRVRSARSVTIRRPAASSFAVRIVDHTATGARMITTRTYNGCSTHPRGRVKGARRAFGQAAST